MTTSGLLVDIRPATPAGRLFPHYDDESNVLSVESSVERAWTYGLDIDGRIIFDLDANRVLASFELLIPRSRWKRELSSEPWPEVSRAGDLQFRQETVAAKSFSSPLLVQANRELDDVLIKIGSQESDRRIMLSDFCVAYVVRDELVGFRIRIPR